MRLITVNPFIRTIVEQEIDEKDIKDFCDNVIKSPDTTAFTTFIPVTKTKNAILNGILVIFDCELYKKKEIRYFRLKNIHTTIGGNVVFAGLSEEGEMCNIPEWFSKRINDKIIWCSPSTKYCPEYINIGNAPDGNPIIQVMTIFRESTIQ